MVETPQSLLARAQTLSITWLEFIPKQGLWTPNKMVWQSLPVLHLLRCEGVLENADEQNPPHTQETLIEKASMKLASGSSLGQADMGCGCHTSCGFLKAAWSISFLISLKTLCLASPLPLMGDTHLPYGESTPAPSESTLETACGVGNIAPNPTTAPDPLSPGRQGAGRAWPHPLAANDAPR